MALTLGWDGEDPEDDLRAWGQGWPVAGFLGAEVRCPELLGLEIH